MTQSSGFGLHYRPSNDDDFNNRYLTFIMADNTNEELERFRNQWREEVTARSKISTSAIGPAKEGSALKSAGAAKPFAPPRPSHISRDEEAEYHDDSEDDLSFPQGALGRSNAGYEGGEYSIEDKEDGYRIKSGMKQKQKEPMSALEHYEKAVERENDGSLGDSLSLYRKAYRLDAAVDKVYKNKHFPPSSSSSKPEGVNPSNAAVTIPNPAHHSLHGPPDEKPLLTIAQLLASFANLSIPSNESPSPPSLFSTIPSEILNEILLHLAILDPASFARLSLVCKKLAYLVASEDRIWRRVCEGTEHGFGSQHYEFAYNLDGTPLSPAEDEERILGDLSSLAITPSNPLPKTNRPAPILLPNQSYQSTFRIRPRIRFNGLYISTVNYVRPGSSSTNQITWNTPVHIVTYYRYLRFFRDGTVLSLTTTAEPLDVVPYLNKEAVCTNYAPGSQLPAAVAKNALTGRWKLSGGPGAAGRSAAVGDENVMGYDGKSGFKGMQDLQEKGTSRETEAEGLLTVETQAQDPKYQFTMLLALRSIGASMREEREGVPKRTRNNKLVWRGLWSYNKLTDDWAPFGLKHDSAFKWSRVRSYV